MMPTQQIRDLEGQMPSYRVLEYLIDEARTPTVVEVEGWDGRHKMAWEDVRRLAPRLVRMEALRARPAYDRTSADRAFLRRLTRALYRLAYQSWAYTY